jgi:putative flippase GtrA
LGLTLIFLFKAGAAMSDVAANLAGYAVAIAAGFALNRGWTFSHRGAAPAALARYLLVLAAAYTANLVATLLAIEVLRLNSYLGQAIGILPYSIVGYVGSRWFAFRTPRPGDQHATN